jgi:hypothetical protein
MNIVLTIKKVIYIITSRVFSYCLINNFTIFVQTKVNKK